MVSYIVDFQGFKRPLNEFTFKEIAVIALEEDATPRVYSMKPPYEWCKLPSRYRSENFWLCCNYHGLTWEGGHIPYENLREVLSKFFHQK